MTQNRTLIKKYAKLIRLFVLLKSSERKVFSKRASYPASFSSAFYNIPEFSRNRCFKKHVSPRYGMNEPQTRSMKSQTP